jgi:PKHD-type hydroxylase
MLFGIANLLDKSAVASIRELLDGASFVDGRLTAGDAVREAKRNLQIADGERALDQWQQTIVDALLRQDGFALRALPMRVLPPMFNRYDAGMEYGSHVDNAVMGGGAEWVRADVSVTVFLSEPEEYEGGGLVIQTEQQGQPIKLAAGSAVVYGATAIHRVEPVTRGRRYAAVTWVQSFVRDEGRREMLMELTEVARWAAAVAPGSAEAMKVAKVRANLMRLWAEP